jgi:hypothetical protein
MTERVEALGYLTAVNRVLERFSARRRLSPAQLLNNWSGFVETTLRGYPAGWYEFDNDRGIRDVIQAVLDDPEVRKYPEAREWARRVADIDDRYRRVLIQVPGQPPDTPWWMAGIPRYASPTLASDVARMYNVEIEARG